MNSHKPIENKKLLEQIGPVSALAAALLLPNQLLRLSVLVHGWRPAAKLSQRDRLPVLRQAFPTFPLVQEPINLAFLKHFEIIQGSFCLCLEAFQLLTVAGNGSV